MPAVPVGWIGILGGSGTTWPNDIAIDSSGNCFVCGYTNLGSQNEMLIAKFNTLGAIQWQNTLSTIYRDEANGIAVDSSGNPHICGYARQGNVDNRQIAKYDTNGNLTFQKRITTSTNGANAITIDGSGNIYVAGSVTVSTTDAQLIKYNSSGNIT